VTLPHSVNVTLTVTLRASARLNATEDAGFGF